MPYTAIAQSILSEQGLPCGVPAALAALFLALRERLCKKIAKHTGKPQRHTKPDKMKGG